MENEDDFVCVVCQMQNAVMKRCTKCHKTIYCSRECQRADWPSHKKVCTKSTSFGSGTLHSELSSADQMHRHDIDDGSIFGKGKNLKEDITYPIHTPLVDFNKAKKTVNKVDNSNLIGKDVRKTGEEFINSYLYYNQVCYDVPVLDISQPCCNITVKSNREKHNIDIQSTWAGQDVFKVLACRLKIPLDTLKIIHKGKVMTPDNIQSCIQNKALFQAIGEQAANEEGVDKRDIKLMMEQLKVSRNEAVLALKRKGDVIDAILEIGNK